jgi:hypothetical protein
MLIQRWSQALGLAFLTSLFVIAAASSAHGQTEALPKKTKTAKPMDTIQVSEPNVAVVKDSADTANKAFNGQPLLRFNSSKVNSEDLGKQKKDPFKFKPDAELVNTDTEEATAVQVPENISNYDESFKKNVGYPKHDVYLGYNFASSNFSQTARTASSTQKTLSYSGASISGLDIGYRGFISKDFRVELEYISNSLPVGAIAATTGTAPNLKTVDSTVTPTTISARSYLCYFDSKWCFGLEVAQNAFPGFKFSTGTVTPFSDKLDVMTDITYAPLLYYSTPSFWNTSFFTDLRYYVGANSAQATGFALQSSSILEAHVGWDKMFNAKHGMNLALTYESWTYTFKTSVIATPTASNGFNQDVTLTNTGLVMGYRYQF